MTSPLRLHQLLRLLDLTRLTEQDTPTEMAQWLQQTARPDAVPAAFCVYPQFIQQTLLHLTQQQMSAPVATVVNFPSGDLAVDTVVQEIEAALVAGAGEIDAVLPYKALLAGDYVRVKHFMYDVRQSCGRTPLKIIIESGELLTAQQICKATELAIEGGADFVKTSTGKVPVGVTLEAARIMLTAIAGAGRPVGFKASGGVRTVAQALELMQLYEDITGQLANPAGMRIGASALLTELLPLLQQA
ncbi:deoxyribose-phosphate aldolase [Rheinheimera texasensis]|uniref:deoxyribose-phosphate aldolase n=1 Tax=Rheinheimera texasensis TaxID=306205 RepID=UPI0032B16718